MSFAEIADWVYNFNAANGFFDFGAERGCSDGEIVAAGSKGAPNKLQLASRILR